MGAWYWIGVCAGLGTAAGVLLAGIAGRVAVVAAIAVGVGIGFAVRAWQSGGYADVALAAVGGALGALGAVPIVRGALTRGGTRGGTSTLIGGAAIVVAAIGWIPVLGYVEALGLPLVAARLRRRSPERYAGLRTLAK